MSVASTIAERVAAHRDPVIALRHDLHAHPQLAYEETHAAGRVQEELSAAGIAFQPGVAETGVVGWIIPDGDAADRPAVALRADMDALPITERSGLPYASQNPGLMHACGHDGHTAMLLGAARVLADLRDQLPQPVKLLFQPAEEGGGGADRMTRAGALTEQIGGLQVAHAFGLHGWPRLPIGTLATRIGPLMAAFDCFTISIQSEGGHAAFPHLTSDAIVAGSHLVTALQTVVSRRIDPVAPAVLSVTQFHGGTADNILPAEVTLGGTIRTVDPDVREAIPQHIRRLTEQIAVGFGCNGEVAIQSGYPVTLNDEQATIHARAALADMVAAGQLLDVPKPVMGAEDFAYFSQAVPSCFLFLGTRPDGAAVYPDLHTDRYDFNDDALPIGIQTLCRCAMRKIDA